MEYLVFGENLVDEYVNSNNSPFKYNGKELDEETGNYYYGARYYDPKFSILISVDPLAIYNSIMETEFYGDGEHNGGVYNSGNLNPYIYCYQNPIIYIDPNGKQVYFNKFTKSSYTGQSWLGKTGTFIGNAVKGTTNGLIDIWNYVGDLDAADKKAGGGFGSGSLDKIESDATNTYNAIKIILKTQL